MKFLSRIYLHSCTHKTLQNHFYVMDVGLSNSSLYIFSFIHCSSLFSTTAHFTNILPHSSVSLSGSIDVPLNCSTAMSFKHQNLIPSPPPPPLLPSSLFVTCPGLEINPTRPLSRFFPSDL